MEPRQPNTPPKWPDKLLAWLVAPHLREEVLGDVHERYYRRAQRLGERKARGSYWREVLAYVRLSVIKRQPNEYPNPTNTDMLRNYFKIAWRNLAKNKAYSAINIGGLAVGMAVAMLIGLWVYDELSFNTYHRNYERIARVMENRTYDGEKGTQWAASPPLGNALRSQYGNDFKHVLMSSNPDRMILSSSEKKLMKSGYYFEPGITNMLSLKMQFGSQYGLKEPNSILLSESVANALFGDADPVGRLMKINNRQDVKVTGVYEDLPLNSDFSDMTFIAPWSLYVSSNEWIKKEAWWQNGFQAYIQIADGADMVSISAKLKNIKLNAVSGDEAKAKPEQFLFPMSQWHLYSEFENGVSVGGRIQFVWLFGIIGAFVLLLACINFMNLSTARSEKRAKEVGIRKAVGSVRSQLISQFFSESFLVTSLAFVLAIGLVAVSLGWFNRLADKQMTMLWLNPYFWLVNVGFVGLTGLLAGSYPAFYLSGFQPIKVLKGTFRLGRFAAIPRKVLVVIQFVVSVTLIIGTIIVYRQIQYAKDRPIGYSGDGLIMIETPTADIHTHFDAVRDELTKSGVVMSLSESLNPMTSVGFSASGYDWTSKETDLEASFATVYIDHEFGRTVGWQFKQGRNFSRQFLTDSSAIVLNEAALKLMGLADPIGKTVRQTDFDGLKTYQIIGVINDMLMESPYAPVRPTIYKINPGKGNFANVKINPSISASDALGKIETVFKNMPLLPPSITGLWIRNTPKNSAMKNASAT